MYGESEEIPEWMEECRDEVVEFFLTSQYITHVYDFAGNNDACHHPMYQTLQWMLDTQLLRGVVFEDLILVTIQEPTRN